MRNLALILILIFSLIGCATSQEVEQYKRDYSGWQKDNAASGDAWQGATGGAYSGGGTGPAPKDPRWPFN